MTDELELHLLQKIAELKQEVLALKGEVISPLPLYSFSKISFDELDALFVIHKVYHETSVFDEWFGYSYQCSADEMAFLEHHIKRNAFLIDSYKEEDLKIYFIAPILNLVDFLSVENEVRAFYEEKITYKTSSFILSGTTDFLIAKGLEYAKRPYFFIQEFKRSIRNDDPRPQLLAELIAAIELNGCLTMKGAYIVGSLWNFVIVEKLAAAQYQYFVSKNFYSTKIEDLQAIYRNLVYVKDEILREAAK